ncbi:hypothetical protein OCF84_21230 (plasmid) [Shewanella xiamenensis]|uniref:Molecular chaperone Tir n=1 Tax=Shewanella xiamenensis TaxID=332186 RepID=A0ABT6UFT9_9GAMM|nr:hypothetical protein [Shewanella xiamenensis]MDI5832600.1 hypothetical protein [Shewanella xiamenensis]WHF57782.1 hypothetical protein OCF84_21230 [Shewanella xiamenensis]
MNTSDIQYLKSLADKLFVGISVENGLDLHILNGDSSCNLVAGFTDVHVFGMKNEFVRKMSFSGIKVASFNGLLESFIKQLKAELHINARCFSDTFYIQEVTTWVAGRLDSLGYNVDAYQIGKGVFIVHMDKLFTESVGE